MAGSFMKKADYYESFKGLDGFIEEGREEAREKDDSLRELRKRVAELDEMKGVIEGMKETPKMEDPGKSGPAYYFVKKIDEEAKNIVRSDRISLMGVCGVCGEEQPVVMRYAQTYDSPMGDTWQKMAFVMCLKDGVTELARFTSDHRF